MSEALTDIEFINKYDHEIGGLYKNAKNVYLDAPIQTLVELRSILELICNQIVEENSLEPKDNSLNSNINEIRNTNTSSPYIIEHFHALRNDTNKAAHKHKHNLTYEEYSELALNNLKRFCELVEDLQVNINKDTQPYKFDNEIESRFYELSYKAMFEEDKEAKFLVGMALVDKHNEQFRTGEPTFFVDDRLQNRAIRLVEEAALDRHPEAMFEYGFILIQGALREKNFDKGMSYLYSASEAGFTKAKAHYADLIFKDRKSSEDDIEYALVLLKESVAEGDVLGQYVLSELYEIGIHVVRDEVKSHELLRLSAEGDYSDASFKYGKHLLEVESDSGGQKYLQRAVYNCNKLAWLYCARNSVKHSGKYDETIEWFEGYLKLCPDDFDVLIELAEYVYSVCNFNLYRIKKALWVLITACRIEEFPLKLRKKANKLSPLWLEEYYKQYIFCGSTDKIQDVFTNFYADGTIIESEFKVGENLYKIAENPSLMKNLIYIPKVRKELKHQKVISPKIADKTGRNEPCPCLSGKKYKYCCS